MRIQMCLSRTTTLAMKEYKEIKFGDSEARVTSGFLVGMAYKALQPKLSTIDWKEIDSAVIPNVTKNNDITITRVQTTLNLDISILDGINRLQEDFVEAFGTKKIYKPFVIKLILLAALLQEKGQI